MSICISTVSPFTSRIPLGFMWSTCGGMRLSLAQVVFRCTRNSHTPQNLSSAVPRLGIDVCHCGCFKIRGVFFEKASLAHCTCRRSLRSIHHAFEHPKVGMLRSQWHWFFHVPKGVPEQVWFYSRLAEKVGGLEFCGEIQENVSKGDVLWWTPTLWFIFFSFFHLWNNTNSSFRRSRSSDPFFLTEE